MHPSDSHSDTDHALLEGLLQLAVEGQTEDQAFQSIGEEVFSRLLDTYGQETRSDPERGRSPGVGSRGSDPSHPQPPPRRKVGLDSSRRK